MSLPRDLEADMGPTLDQGTAERLVRGMHPDDAPPGYAEVAALLARLSNVEPADDGRIRATVDAMAASVEPGAASPPVADKELEMIDVLDNEQLAEETANTHPPRRVRPRRFVRSKVVALATTALLLGTVGMAFAGELPGAAQDVARTMLAKLGVSVPGPNEHAGDHPNTRGNASTQPPAAGTAGDGAPADVADDSRGKGSTISQIATSTTATGVAKGAEICTAASKGACQAGQHGQAANPHGQAADPHGQADEPHGQSDHPHDQAGQLHGQAGDTHGQAGGPPSNAPS